LNTQTESIGASSTGNSATPKTSRHGRSNGDLASRRSPSQMFDLEDVIRTNYGFDFFMRHLVKEFCHENLLSFYEMEKFQEVILGELQVQYNNTYNDTQSLVLIVFPKNLPKPYILTYPIEVQVVLLDEQTGAVIEEAKLENDEKLKKEDNTDKEHSRKKSRTISVLKREEFEKLEREDSKDDEVTEADEIEYEKKND